MEEGIDRTYSRRQLLAYSLTVAGGLALARVPSIGASPGSKEIDAFVQLSRITTGVEHLPRQHAVSYMNALNEAGLELTPADFLNRAGFTHGRGPETLAELEHSSAYKSRGGKACVDAVASAWWSGIVPTRGGGQKVVTYLDALVWHAVPYAYPPTECLGATGAWAKPGRKV